MMLIAIIAPHSLLDGLIRCEVNSMSWTYTSNLITRTTYNDKALPTSAYDDTRYASPH